MNLDYFVLKDDAVIEAEDHEERSIARVHMTCMCMQETLCSSVWGYAVQHKGAGEEWLIQQLTEDIGTIGMAGERIIVKSDQESAMNDVQNALVGASWTGYSIGELQRGGLQLQRQG